MITSKKIEQLCTEFEFEGQTFIPIYYLTALALDKTYDEVVNAYVEIKNETTQVCLKTRFISTYGNTNVLIRYYYFYIDFEGNFSLRRSCELYNSDKLHEVYLNNCQNMIQIVTCLQVWGFIDDLPNTIINAGLINKK